MFPNAERFNQTITVFKNNELKLLFFLEFRLCMTAEPTV